MALLCHAERKIRGGPCLTAVGPRLSLEPCRIVTSPPVTGLVVSIGVYGESFPATFYGHKDDRVQCLILLENEIASLDYTVMAVRIVVFPPTSHASHRRTIHRRMEMV